ncbi:MAG: hypothetical protein QXI37_03430, partial [Thermoprotei archaeon]
VRTRKMGMRVSYSPNAKVEVAAPTTMFGLLYQRARIIRGHIELFALEKTPPTTIETSMLISPALTARTVFSLLKVVGLSKLAKAVLAETAAWILALSMIPFDKKPWIWQRVDAV